MNRTNFHYTQTTPPAAKAERMRALIAAFLDAATTRSEEDEIYTFFRIYGPGTLDPSLEQYRGMFAWYGNLAAPVARTPGKRRIFPRWLLGVAAGVALLLVGGAAFTIGSRFPRHAAADSQGIHLNDVGSTVGTAGLNDTLEAAPEDTLILHSLSNPARK